jgi:DNA-binding MarR family transcriptional regulator
VINLNSQLLRDEGALVRAIHVINEAKFKQYNLQKGQFIFVTRICENLAINLVALSDLLKMDKTTTTKAVQKLISEGYVNKEQDQLDKRIWRLFPTESALQLYDVIIAEENRALEICLRGLSAK